MKSSNNFLLKQFLDTKDEEPICLDENFYQEFYIWLKQMQEISKYYIDFLEEMGFEFKENNCAEISKSFFDTTVKPFDTHLITLYENGLNDIGEKRVIKGNLVVNKGKPIILDYKKKKLCFPSDSYATFMTQNPYEFGDFKKLELLHNSGNYNIIAGVFGFIDDRNKSKKVGELKRLRDSLYGDYNYDFERKDGVYCYALGTKKRIRK